MLWCVSLPHSFLLPNNILLYGQTTFWLVIRQSMGHFLTVVSHAAINICAQIFAWISLHVSLWYTPRCGILGAYGNSMFNFSRISEAIFHSNCSIIHSRQFLHILANISYHLSFSFKSKCPQLLRRQLTGECEEGQSWV